MRETSLMRAIRAAVNVLPGARFWRNNVGVDSERGVRYGLGIGSADLVGVVHGTFVALEVKTTTGRVSDDQTRWLDAVRRCGGVAEVVRSVEDAVRVVQGVSRGR